MSPEQLDDRPANGTDAPDTKSKTNERSTTFCTCSETPAHLRAASTNQNPAPESTPTDKTTEIADKPQEETATSNRQSQDADSTTHTPPNTHKKDIHKQEEPDSLQKNDDSSEEPLISSVSDLLPGESKLFSSMTHGRGGSEVVLTEKRVVLRGAPDAKVLHATMLFSEVDSITVARSKPNNRSLIWGLIGIGAAIGIWQALDGVGNLRLIIAAIVVLMSIILLADYFLRPPDIVVGLRARSGAEMNIDFGQAHAVDADHLAARIISMIEMRSDH